jgi:hypothetical protein
MVNSPSGQEETWTNAVGRKIRVGAVSVTAGQYLAYAEPWARGRPKRDEIAPTHGQPV